MINAGNKSTIKIRDQTRNQFFVRFENGFLVLPDAKTVVGADGSDREKLIVEDITQGNLRQIGRHGVLIYTVLFDNHTQSLLVGDYNGHVKQYKKVNQSFTMVKDYGNVGVGVVCSSTQVGRLGIFGGNNRSLIAIDIAEQRVCPGFLKSPFWWTYSLQVCEGAGSKVYLSQGGDDPDYSSDASDFLDVTLLYNSLKKDSPKVPKDINKAHAALREKDILINSLKLKIKQLESSLQKQVNKNEGKSNPKTSKTKTKS